MTLLSVVAPVFCEALHLEDFVAGLAVVLDSLATERALAYEIILVDDGSTDGTWDCMRNMADKKPFLHCVKLSRNFGKDAALAAGLDAARGDAVITMDSDMQHPASLIPEMVALWQKGDVDVVDICKQERQQESPISRLCALAFYRVFSLLTSYDLRGSGDFKLLDRKVIEAWKKLGERKLFYRGLTSWMGFRHAQLFFTPSPRASGCSKWSMARRIALAVDSITSFSSKPVIIIWIMALLFYIFSLGVGCEALWSYATGNAESGFTTVILLILVTGSSILTAQCVLSAYIHNTFAELKGRPRYLVADTAKSHQSQP